MHRRGRGRDPGGGVLGVGAARERRARGRLGNGVGHDHHDARRATGAYADSGDDVLGVGAGVHGSSIRFKLGETWVTPAGNVSRPGSS